MVVLYLVPRWFVGIDVTLEILFAFVTFLVALFSFRIYRISEQRELRLFGIAFSLISVSYILRAILNSFVISELNDKTQELALGNLQALSLLGVFLHIIFFTAGLITIIYTTMRTKNERTYLLLIFMGVMLILLSADAAVSFYLLSSVLLLFIVIHYLQEYKNKRNPRTLMILIAFTLLFVSSFDYLYSTKEYVHYVIAHILEFGAYILTVISLVKAVKNEQKKK